MADTPDPQKPSKGIGSMSVEQRMLLAFGLVGLVLVLSQFLFAPDAPIKTGPTQQKPATAQQVKEPAPAAPAATATPPAATPAGDAAVVKAEKSETYVIDTDVFRVVFSNHGAVVRSWTLKNYLDSSGKPLELVNVAAAQKTHYPFSLLFEQTRPSTDLNKALFAATVSPDNLGITFEYSDGRTSGKKTFRFAKNSYLVDLKTEIRDGANTVLPHLVAWRGGFGDRHAYAAAAGVKTLYFNQSENKLVENEVKEAEDGPVLTSGNYSFAGIEDAYFLSVFLPADQQGMRVQTLSDTVALVQDGKEEAVAGVGVGSGGSTNHFQVFVGPKDLDLLRRVNPKLESAVDFGWFTFLARPIFLALNWLNDNWVRNYGWSIVLLTILINMLLLPLKISGMKGMKKMASLQPEVQAINEKYKGLSIRDPQKAKQNEEIMALYKKHGVNPLGAGCMPLLLQIPFFFAFYKVLSIAIELRGADWLWIKDLAQYDPLYLLPIVMVVSQFIMQKMTPSTTADPAQQRMMLFMPLLFGFFFFTASAGLVLYWLTSNVVGILQQMLINRMSPTPVPVAATSVVNAKSAPGKKNRK